MRSNNLKRHKKTHKDLLSLPDNEIKDELKSRQEFKKQEQEEKKKQEEKIQKIVEIVRENNLAISEEIVNKKSDEEKALARCLQNHQLYLEKIKLGKLIAIIIESGKVLYESLGKIDKEAFDTYRNSNSI